MYDIAMANPDMDKGEDSMTLRETAARLCQPGKGILASDESPSTMGKRLVKAGKDNTAENRRQYRSLFYGAALGDSISGAILHPEALDMQLDEGVSFVEALSARGILVGVKVDEGLQPLEGGYEGETSTKGLETLGVRLEEYRTKGATFAKWRAAFRICKLPDEGDGVHYSVSDVALKTNAEQLASYALQCQIHNIVPIVEPEILIDGDHDSGTCSRITKLVLVECVRALIRHDVHLGSILLKPQMVVPGVENVDNVDGGVPEVGGVGGIGRDRDPTVVAERTLEAIRETVPPAVQGIMFLSGGQTEYQSTINLNTLNVIARACPEFRVPYALSFSFGRGLQASVLDMWSRGESKEACMKKAEEIARVNGLATRGAYVAEGGHPTVLAKGGNLQETFRGVY